MLLVNIPVSVNHMVRKCTFRQVCPVKKKKKKSLPSEDSDQTAQLCSLIRIFTGCILITNSAKFIWAKKDSDQFAQICRLI